jgi:hypothetical protein
MFQRGVSSVIDIQNGSNKVKMLISNKNQPDVAELLKMFRTAFNLSKVIECFSNCFHFTRSVCATPCIVDFESKDSLWQCKM